MENFIFCAVKKGFLKTFAKFAREYRHWSLFLNKIAIWTKIAGHWIRITNIIRMFVYGFLDLNEGFRNVFAGHSHFKELL